MGQVDAAAARLLLQTTQRSTSGEVGGRLGCGGLRCGVGADVAVGDPPVAFDEDAAPHDDDVDLSVNELFATAALASDHPAPAHAPLGASNALLFLAATSLAGSPPGSATRAAEGAHDPRAEDAAAPRDGKHGESAWRMLRLFEVKLDDVARVMIYLLASQRRRVTVARRLRGVFEGASSAAAIEPSPPARAGSAVAEQPPSRPARGAASPSTIAPRRRSLRPSSNEKMQRWAASGAAAERLEARDGASDGGGVIDGEPGSPLIAELLRRNARGGGGGGGGDRNRARRERATSDEEAAEAAEAHDAEAEAADAVAAHADAPHSSTDKLEFAGYLFDEFFARGKARAVGGAAVSRAWRVALDLAAPPASTFVEAAMLFYLAAACGALAPPAPRRIPSFFIAEAL